jgi:hypothetical protein
LKVRTICKDVMVKEMACNKEIYLEWTNQVERGRDQEIKESSILDIGNWKGGLTVRTDQREKIGWVSYVTTIFSDFRFHSKFWFVPSAAAIQQTSNKLRRSFVNRPFTWQTNNGWLHPLPGTSAYMRTGEERKLFHLDCSVFCWKILPGKVRVHEGKAGLVIRFKPPL